MPETEHPFHVFEKHPNRPGIVQAYLAENREKMPQILQAAPLIGSGGFSSVRKLEKGLAVKHYTRVTPKLLTPPYQKDISEHVPAAVNIRDFEKLEGEKRILKIKDKDLLSPQLDEEWLVYMDELPGKNMLPMRYMNDFSPSVFYRIASDCLDIRDRYKELGLVSRDFKSSNFQIDPSGKLRCMDFELNTTAKVSEASGNTEIIIGTPKYLAPELFKGVPHTADSDAFSLGMTLLEITSGQTLQDLLNTHQVVEYYIALMKKEATRQCLENLLKSKVHDETLKTVIRTLLNFEPKARELSIELRRELQSKAAPYDHVRGELSDRCDDYKKVAETWTMEYALAMSQP